MAGFLRKMVSRIDSWTNSWTGLGDEDQDKLLQASVSYRRMSEQEIDSLYASNDLAEKIVEELPYEAFRAGYELTLGADPKKGDALQTFAKSLGEGGLDSALILGWIWGRLYGGAGVVFIPDNLNVLQDEFKPGEAIRNLMVLSAFELWPDVIQLDPRAGNFGYPERYSIQPRSGRIVEGLGASIKVHHSRVVRFDGRPLSRQYFIANNYWHDSYLNKTKRHISNFDQSVMAMVHALQDFSVAKYKLKGYADMMSADDQKLLDTRMAMLSKHRSVSRTVLLDADGEDFDFGNRQLTGVSDCVERASLRLAAAADRIPHTRLFGESPKGSQATGNSTTTGWYDFVANQQNKYLLTRLMKAYALIAQSQGSPTQSKLPQDMSFTFSPLWQQTEKETAESRFLQAQADNIYLDQGVVDPTEVRDSRFQPGGFSYEMQLTLGEAPGRPEPEPTPAPKQLPKAKE